MPFHARMVAPLKTDKHETSWSFLAADMGTAKIDVTLANSVAAEDKGAKTEVMVGSHVDWIYIEMNIAAETITNPKVLHWSVQLRPNGVAAQDPINYYSIARAQTIKRGMEMLPKNVSTVFKRIFTVKIPKKARRMAMSDIISIHFKCSSTESVNVCGFAIYKEKY